MTATEPKKRNPQQIRAAYDPLTKKTTVNLYEVQRHVLTSALGIVTALQSMGVVKPTATLADVVAELKLSE